MSSALVVDDDGSFRKLISVALERLGVFSTTVANSEEFQSLLKVGEFDLVFIDLNLGGGDPGEGFKLIEYTRQVAPSRIPVIVISGEDDPIAVAHAMELGATDYVLKPFDYELLAAKLSRYIKSPELLDLQGMSYVIPNASIPARLKLGFSVTEIDEMGVSLVGAHLLSKGSAVRVSSPIFEEILPGNPGILLSVTSNWVDSSMYGAYAEFDPHDTRLTDAVRRWIVSRRSS